ncbi:hypothetical protein TNCV_1933201 [Trichonephila clavipes]|nr:hypothetical protein TNCV_1933201 [Trichonephila clavipes]
MLIPWMVPQLQDNIYNFIFQLGGAPLHWSANVRDYLDEHLPLQRIERVVNHNMPLTQWPSRSPDYTLRDFYQGNT